MVDMGGGKGGSAPRPPAPPPVGVQTLGSNMKRLADGTWEWRNGDSDPVSAATRSELLSKVTRLKETKRSDGKPSSWQNLAVASNSNFLTRS